MDSSLPCKTTTALANSSNLKDCSKGDLEGVITGGEWECPSQDLDHPIDSKRLLVGLQAGSGGLATIRINKAGINQASDQAGMEEEVDQDGTEEDQDGTVEVAEDHPQGLVGTAEDHHQGLVGTEEDHHQGLVGMAKVDHLHQDLTGMTKVDHHHHLHQDRTGKADQDGMEDLRQNGTTINAFPIRRIQTIPTQIGTMIKMGLIPLPQHQSYPLPQNQFLPLSKQRHLGQRKLIPLTSHVHPRSQLRTP